MTVFAAAAADAAGDPAIARALLGPYFIAARRRASCLAAAAGLRADDGLVDGLARHLVDRVAFAAAGLARHGALSSAESGARGGELRRALFEEYPVLPRILGTTWSGWSAFTAAMITRLARDLDEIRGSLLCDTSAQPTWCAPAAGDVHNGASVTIVGFTGGRRAVYRPRDSSHLVAWGALLDLIAAANPAQRLRCPRVLARDGYAWVEFIEQEHPRGPAEQADLCRRIGMTARLAELLGAVDMSGENFVVARDQVMLVDTETILAPEMRGSAAKDIVAPPAREPAFTIAASTGFLSMPMTLGTRVPLGNAALPARSDYAFVAANTPLLLDGYAAMHRTLARHLRREGRLAAILRLLGHARLRFVARNTYVYGLLLQSALEPDGLRDEREFERRLARLDRAVAAAPEEAREAVGCLVEAEASALRALDIPYFDMAATSTDVMLSADGRSHMYANESPCARAASRLAAIGPAPAPEELNTVRALLAAAAPAGIVGTEPGVPIPACTVADIRKRASRYRPHDWPDLAAKVATVLADRIDTDGGALAFRPYNGVVVLQRLGPDLLSGYAGLAVVLADAAVLLDDHGLRNCASALAVRVQDSLRSDLLELHRPKPREALDAGAYCGLGAHIYSLARIEDSLGPIGSPWRDEVSAALPDGDAIERAATRHGWDLSLATGTAGLVLALDAAAPAPGLARWWPGFVTRSLRLATALAPGSHPIAVQFFPSELASAYFAATRLGITLRAVRSPPGTGNEEPAMRPADRLLSRVTKVYRDGLVAAAGALVEDPGSWTSLAALEEIEVGLGADGPSAEAGQMLAERAGRLLAERKARTAAWFPESVAPDRYRLSALWGLGAVCHAFVRLAAPTPPPSIRLIMAAGPPRKIRAPSARPD